MTIEYVDVLAPPTFERTGKVMPVLEAIQSGHWIGVMNIWLVRASGSILYQQRPGGGWEPGKLDGSVGGYYRAGEGGLDGLREMEEELGWNCPRENVDLLGRHLSVGVDSSNRERRLAVNVYMALCDVPLSGFALDEREVPALFDIPGEEVITAFSHQDHRFVATGIDCAGRVIERPVSADDFSYVFGGYHLKIAQIARRYALGERQFCY